MSEWRTSMVQKKKGFTSKRVQRAKIETKCQSWFDEVLPLMTEEQIAEFTYQFQMIEWNLRERKAGAK